MFKAAVSSLKTSVVERVSSPLAGSFILSWLVWNWKMVATLLMGNETPSARIQAIQKSYYDADHLIIYPAISCVTFIVFYPIFSLAAFVIWEWVGPTKRRIKAYFEDKTPLTPEEARNLRAALMEERGAMEKLWEGKESELKALKVELNIKDDKLHELQNKVAQNEEQVASLLAQLDQHRERGADDQSSSDITKVHLNSESIDEGVEYLTTEETEILAQIANAPRTVSTEDYLIGASQSPVRMKYNLSELLNKNYVDCTFSSNEGDYLYGLTQKGRSYLVRNGFV